MIYENEHNRDRADAEDWPGSSGWSRSSRGESSSAVKTCQADPDDRGDGREATDVLPRHVRSKEEAPVPVALLPAISPDAIAARNDHIRGDGGRIDELAEASDPEAAVLTQVAGVDGSVQGAGLFRRSSGTLLGLMDSRQQRVATTQRFGAEKGLMAGSSGGNGSCT